MSFFVTLGILVSFELVCSTLDSNGSVENDKFDTLPDSLTNIFSVSGRNSLNLSRDIKTLKGCCETIWNSKASKI